VSGSEHFGVARGLHSLAQPANQTELPMMNPAQPSKLDEFFERLREAPARALILDYDGTLAPFERHPGCAVPYAGVRPLVDAIMAEPSTRVVVVSGRWTIDLLPVLGFERVPELWASHGWERLSPEGEYALESLPEDASRLLAETDRWALKVEALGGRRELKPGSLAFHWRGLGPKQIDAIRQLVLEHWVSNQLHRALDWREFDGGIELLVPGRDKGYAVEVVLAELGDQASAAAYLGDDLADESAFRALRGRGLGVLVRPEFRHTAADAWVQPPAGLLAFLERWQACAISSAA
jgi:trehalose-phosphatase